jgi:hypothetical protein
MCAFVINNYVGVRSVLLIEYCSTRNVVVYDYSHMIGDCCGMVSVVVILGD